MAKRRKKKRTPLTRDQLRAGTICQGAKLDGTRCRGRAQKGWNTCPWHHDQDEAVTAEAFARMAAAGTGPAGPWRDDGGTVGVAPPDGPATARRRRGRCVWTDWRDRRCTETARAGFDTCREHAAAEVAS